ncbi:MAG TPA: flagellar hook-basal body protein [Candidatus Krumholzibacteria bacterium]|nr:flagellar hook-basal body protein [Candidatus Krumholzibacteria bacterium]HPD71662.1 flagellar hook-basal body protein [Candidatus Krumholzibacteria bacterium]HRY41405.1 flagellar hook-basal body protein [Candidatus Krumholzibacteria bacterium]
MLRNLQTARQAMLFEQARIDALANNLANAATTGFRQVLTRVTEQAATGQAGKPAARGGEADLVMSQIVDPRAGQLQTTGRGTDLALSGRGFFAVRDEEGNDFYTRDGAFRIDDTGRLVTARGLAVQGSSGPIQATGGVIAVDAEGNVSVDGAARGRLRLVDFAAPERLQHRGDGMLVANPEDAPVEIAAGEITVLQGYLEDSNVDPVQTLVDMIAAQRAFEIETKVLQASDEMLAKSVNTLGRNG